MDRQRYPSYDNNERRAKQFAENAGYLEDHSAEIAKARQTEDESTKSAFLQRGIDVDGLEKELWWTDIPKILEIAND